MLWSGSDSTAHCLSLNFLYFPVNSMTFSFYISVRKKSSMFTWNSRMTKLMPILAAVPVKITPVLFITLIIREISHQPKILHMLCISKGQICRRIYYISLEMSHSALRWRKNSLHFKEGGIYMAHMPPVCPLISFSERLIDEDRISCWAFWEFSSQHKLQAASELELIWELKFPIVTTM